MKIIYYSPHPTHDIVSEVGYSTHQRETIAAFRDLGHTVELVIMGGTEKSSVENNIQLISKSSSIKKIIKKITPIFIWNAIKDLQLIKHDENAKNTLEKCVNLFHPDLIYERNEYMQNSGVKIAKKYGITHYLEVNSPCVSEMAKFEGPSALRFVGHFKERKKLKHTQKVFAISTSMAIYLQNKYNYKKPISIIPNCINENVILPNESEIVLKRKNTIPDNKIVVGFVGSLFPYHGIDILIKGFALAYEKNKNLFLYIIGDGVIKRQMEKLCTDLLPDSAYLFAGKIPHNEIYLHIGCFDIAVMAASNWYGSPIKIFEYGIMEKITIAPNNIPVKDAMENDVDGVLIDRGPEYLVQALNKIIENFPKHQQMASHFKTKILQEFTWKKQAEKILS